MEALQTTFLSPSLDGSCLAKYEKTRNRTFRRDVRKFPAHVKDNVSPIAAVLRSHSSLEAVARPGLANVEKEERIQDGTSSPSPPYAETISSSESTYDYDLQVATRAVQLACRLTRRVQDSLRQREDVATNKKDKSFVTVADWGVQAVVSWILAQAYPGVSVSMVAEEDTKDLRGESNVTLLQRLVRTVNEALAEAHIVGLEPPSQPLTAVDVLNAILRGGSSGDSSGRHWVLDPVDGTLGFVRHDQYAVALALVDNGQIVLGVLGCPNFPMRPGWLRHPHKYHRLAEKYFAPSGGYDSDSDTAQESSPWIRGCILRAQKGKGTFMESVVDDQGVVEDAGRVSTSDIVDPSMTTFCEPVEKGNSDQSFTAKLAENLGIRSSPLRVYSMAKYTAIARGDAEIFMKFARAGYKEKVWDHAAGVIVVEEAGGVVTDAGGKPLDFSQGRFLEGLDRGIVATSSKELHAKILNAVDDSWDSSSL